MRFPGRCQRQRPRRRRRRRSARRRSARRRGRPPPGARRRGAIDRRARGRVMAGLLARTVLVLVASGSPSALRRRLERQDVDERRRRRGPRAPAEAVAVVGRELADRAGLAAERDREIGDGEAMAIRERQRAQLVGRERANVTVHQASISAAPRSDGVAPRCSVVVGSILARRGSADSAGPITKNSPGASLRSWSASRLEKPSRSAARAMSRSKTLSPTRKF